MMNPVGKEGLCHEHRRMTMPFVNCTPHAIVMNDGRTFEPSGHIARVATSFEETAEIAGIPVYRIETGAVTGLPPEAEGVFYIVSAMVLGANNSLREGRRYDLVAPSTGHASTVRYLGNIVSVGGFVV
jgi:hypothetical protein